MLGFIKENDFIKCKSELSQETQSYLNLALMKNARCLGRSERFQIAVRSVAATMKRFNACGKIFTFLRRLIL